MEKYKWRDMCSSCKDDCEIEPVDCGDVIGYPENYIIIGCSDYSTRNPIRYLFYKLWGTPYLRDYLKEREEERLYGFKGE